MSPGEVALILFGTFGVLVILRVPVGFALGLAAGWAREAGLKGPK